MEFEEEYEALPELVSESSLTEEESQEESSKSEYSDYYRGFRLNEMLWQLRLFCEERGLPFFRRSNILLELK